MSEQIKFRCSKEEKEKIREEAKFRGLTISELIKESLKHYFSCDKLKMEIPTLKLIITKYTGNCSKCGRVIQVGERALWGKTPQGSILICADCQINSESDKVIVKRLIKRRKLERQIKALQNQLDYLASEYESKRFILDFQKAKDIILELHKSFMEYQREFYKFNTEETNKKINEMIETLRKAIRQLNDFETFYQLKIKAKIKTKRRA